MGKFRVVQTIGQRSPEPGSTRTLHIIGHCRPADAGRSSGSPAAHAKLKRQT